MILCPCCKQSMPGSPDLNQLKAFVTAPMQQRILQLLVRSYPLMLSRDQIVEGCYGHRSDGGPLYAPNIVTINILRLRQKLFPLNWTIPKNRGGRECQGLYRLERIERKERAA